MQTIVLKPFDAAWFYVEKAETPANVGPLLILTPPAGAPDNFISEFVEQWRQCKTFMPPFNYRIRRNPIPVWEVLPDDAIDLDYHLRHSALPAPGGERELGVMISRLHSHPLDLKRPLWECHVIEGLAGGRFAIYMKFHHGQLDGVATTRLFEGVLSSDRSARGMLPPWAVGVRSSTGRDSKQNTTPSSGMGLRNSLGGIAGAAKGLFRMATTIRSGSEPELTGPFQAPDTIFNGRISAQRRFATQQYELARFKRVAKATEVSVNDVFLAVTGGAMRRYLMEVDALPERSIVGQVPVSVRATDSNGVGNQIAFMYARLRTDIEDPLERLAAVHASTAAGKAMHESLPAESVTPFTMLLSGPYIAQTILGLGGRVSPAANLVISNVPGPPAPLFFNGASVEEMYGPSVLFHGQALNITMFSYAGRANISYTGCRDSMPSMQKLAVYTGEALDHLESAVGAKIS
ncbi:wax ester/triacylglycerol synthase family O-acyltransferase [Antrihabitans sp. YC2-6]|uniref:WS/DGAT/MGAT family O-acyltransferase n=1 Tax=Antrihabitans sp. YC2-6 TaxID=2799498 RepID=UPI0018F60048|nr:wax ester/triacylglycerol synthase family O-acyltransferase [Antrihabitans sp. YC2-6]MBJ8343875.1 wax ester/triacylglycerol synthase family O-acyltransferase [Antrihabitans sp. YC2-6]